MSTNKQCSYMIKKQHTKKFEQCDNIALYELDGNYYCKRHHTMMKNKHDRTVQTATIVEIQNDTINNDKPRIIDIETSVQEDITTESTQQEDSVNEDESEESQGRVSGSAIYKIKEIGKLAITPAPTPKPKRKPKRKKPSKVETPSVKESCSEDIDSEVKVIKSKAIMTAEDGIYLAGVTVMKFSEDLITYSLSPSYDLTGTTMRCTGVDNFRPLLLQTMYELVPSMAETESIPAWMNLSLIIAGAIYNQVKENHKENIVEEMVAKPEYNPEFKE